MANTTQDTLYETFAEAAEGFTSDLSSLSNASQELTSSGGGAATGASAKESGDHTAAEPESHSQSASSSGKSGGSDALSIATTVLESGLGIVPLVAGLIGLFTGGSSTPAPLAKYAMPEAMQFEGADTGSGMSDADFDQMGMPRDFSGTPGGTPSTPAGPQTASGGSNSPATAPQIQVTVQAMDAQSFLDHSSDIAQAVRSAMLNLSSLNDVVSDL